MPGRRAPGRAHRCKVRGPHRSIQKLTEAHHHSVLLSPPSPTFGRRVAGAGDGLEEQLDPTLMPSSSTTAATEMDRDPISIAVAVDDWSRDPQP
jgi:hypothetical protein